MKTTTKLGLSVLTAAAILIAPTSLSFGENSSNTIAQAAEVKTVTVTTFTELKKALETSPTDIISIAADITATSDIAITGQHNPLILGNNHKLDMGKYVINAKQFGVIALEDLSIESTGSYGIYRTDTTGQLALHNVTFTGKQVAYAPKGSVTFHGNVKVTTTSTLEIAKVNTIVFDENVHFTATTTADAFLMAQANPKVYVSKNANINIISQKKVFNMTGATPLFSTEAGSKLTTKSVDVALYMNGKPTFGANSSTEFNQDATGTAGLIYASTGLNAEKDANFVLNGSTKSTQLIKTSKSVIDFNDVANVDLKSNNVKGNIFNVSSGSLVQFNTPQTLTLGSKTTDTIFTATNLRAFLSGSGTNLSVYGYMGDSSILNYDFKTMGSFKLTK
ncbi:pectate lyase-like adhesive domain-containing protein [Listeria rocourtiae]|uniref:pectate lyase-like adhesive domain-containing protein n=1 Tax=Listeria rocourtiae TaxID=647910 RepID=UPI003D2F97B2